MKDSLDSTHGNLVNRNYDDWVVVNGGVIAIYHYMPPPKLWNKFPVNIITTTSLASFRSSLLIFLKSLD